LRNCQLVRYSKNRLDLDLKLVEVLYLFVNLVRCVTLVVLLHEWFDLFKSLSTHEACDKSNLLFLRYLFSLEHKEEILLEELVVKLRAFSIVQVRLVNIDASHIGRIRGVSYVNICGRARATRGSMGS
jgi:hypothetical protein